MKTYLPYSLILAAAASGMASGAETAYTTPVGYVTQTAAANSDTIVGLSLRKASVAAGALSGVPDTVTTPGSAILSLSGTLGFTVNAYSNAYYAKFKSGAASGKWFAISSNTASGLTVDLNGATLTAAASDTLEVIKFWTLTELIDPATATTDPLTTPNAVVASTSTLTGGRRTQLLIPNLSSNGINLAPSVSYFVHGGLWKKPGQGDTSFGGDMLWPDTYFIIRNPAAVTAATKYTIAGEVEPSAFDFGLRTQITGQQDNAIALPRPVDVALSGLGLGGTSGFVSSTSTLTGGRRDQVLVYDNTAAAQNKAPSASYFYHNGLWKKPGQGDTDFGTDVIKAGSGIVVRKYQSATGATDIWHSLPSY